MGFAESGARCQPCLVSGAATFEYGMWMWCREWWRKTYYVGNQDWDRYSSEFAGLALLMHQLLPASSPYYLFTVKRAVWSRVMHMQQRNGCLQLQYNDLYLIMSHSKQSPLIDQSPAARWAAWSLVVIYLLCFFGHALAFLMDKFLNGNQVFSLTILLATPSKSIYDKKLGLHWLLQSVSQALHQHLVHAEKERKNVINSSSMGTLVELGAVRVPVNQKTVRYLLDPEAAQPLVQLESMLANRRWWVGFIKLAWQAGAITEVCDSGTSAWGKSQELSNVATASLVRLSLGKCLFDGTQSNGPNLGRSDVIVTVPSNILGSDAIYKHKASDPCLLMEGEESVSETSRFQYRDNAVDDQNSVTIHQGTAMDETEDYDEQALREEMHLG
ncbi:hypothetical protein SODALDRAFT_378017 [Sodiomyces alkalinus F11]|uniref:Uncharacterized protein n=1 Tax=Sodiomyces alkalinus (strain CBS 110278 / VKM F-3762 / F11) TaxID=1314773 RepID=A0A3N2PWI0_SODAK|nr:hypothetical protein SODALDRAFT_382407 [Sodiomyces alkalinus F11]XP_028466676.1 hypothetical protein SODALDRAFT_378017 [Sodiomyces alkalinus F11]ROT34612.1 hypothetical protein SODALDRAFT_382407 [Sodiomyces alkalinus F11]ROT38870.1 hypothetical protein SODALDRAFT_378017 [Sodiomyces alkalinus F11]